MCVRSLCFLTSVVSGKHGKSRNGTNISSYIVYQMLLNLYGVDEMTMPESDFLHSFSEKERKILKERSLIFSREETMREDTFLDTYIHFRLGVTEQYGIPYGFAEEIMYSTGLVRVPCVPAFIAGIVNRRGKMLTVLDIKQFFRVNGKEYGDESRVIVIKGCGLTVGILADELYGNKEYDPAKLMTPLPSDGISNIKYVSGIDRGNVTLLNIHEILSDPLIKINERVAL